MLKYKLKDFKYNNEKKIKGKKSNIIIVTNMAIFLNHNNSFLIYE